MGFTNFSANPTAFCERLSKSCGARAALLAAACTLATHAAFFGGDRYHLPLVPLLAVLTAYALREPPRARRNSSTAVHRTPLGSPKSS